MQTCSAKVAGVEASSAHVNVKGGGEVNREGSTHRKQSCDKIRCRAGTDGDVAMHAISVPVWSSVTTLKKHPTEPEEEAQYKQWRELYEQPPANGFCQSDMPHMIRWDRAPKHEQVEMGINLRAQVGYMVCARGCLRNKKVSLEVRHDGGRCVQIVCKEGLPRHYVKLGWRTSVMKWVLGTHCNICNV